jgi:hypothetical protein
MHEGVRRIEGKLRAVVLESMVNTLTQWFTDGLVGNVSGRALAQPIHAAASR